jgi:hypothetical protein
MDYLIYGGAALLGLYLAARLMSAAYFKSKQQYEENKYGGLQKPKS